MNPQATTGKGHRHERKDADVPSLILIIAMLMVSGMIIFLTVTGLMHYFRSNEAKVTSGQTNIPVTAIENFPEPRLEVQSSADLKKLRAAEEGDLQSYGWLEKNSGTVRIPIDRAMQLLVERGLPEVGAGKTPLSLMQARPSERATPPRLMQNETKQ
jgi:hypothetical protein